MAKTSVKEFKLVNVELLVPYANNARTHSKEQIKKLQSSLREFGFINPLIIDREYNVLAGHGRLSAAKAEGYKEVPCVFVEDLTKAQKKAYMLADNRMALDAGWDFELLSVELEELKELDFDIGLTGFSGEELSDIFGEEEHDVVEDDFEVNLPEEAKTKLGDIYQLGRHRLMCGDGTDRQCVELLMDGVRADIAFSSPPYNAGTTATETAMNKTTKYNGNDDNKSESDYIEFLNSYIERAMEYSEYVFMNVQSISNNKIALIDVLYHNKDIYADTIVWDKIHGQPAMAKNVMNSVFEYVHVFSKKANRAIGTIPFRGTVDNIFHLQPQRNNAYSAIHNATFSVEFARHFIKTFAKESVLDQFGGTGTTLIACEQLDRTCYMMELDPKYCDVIIRRYVENTGDAENVYCIRNGQKVAYADVVKQVDGSSDNSSTNDLI